MWECKYIDECHLCNIAFSEEFSFCVSNPQYAKDEIFYKSLITSKSSSYLGDDLRNERRRKSSPIPFKSMNPHCSNYSPFLNPYKALIRTTNFLGAQEFSVNLTKRDGSLGITIAVFIGGIFIKALTRKHAASGGKIWPGDRILQVNGRDISSFSLSQAIIYLRNVPNSVILKLCRSCSVWSFCPKHSPPKVETFNVVLDKLPNDELGISLSDSSKGSDIRKYVLPCVAEVETVYPGSLAYKNGIQAGDRILEVNGDCLLGKKADEVIDILQKTNGVMKIVLCRLLQLSQVNFSKKH